MNEQTFYVGQIVTFNDGSRKEYGIVKEDRGPIGMKGRVLYLVELGPDPDFPELAHIELPAEELEEAKMFHVYDTKSGIDVFLKADPNKDPKKDKYMKEILADVSFIARERLGPVPAGGAYPNVIPFLGVSGKSYREFNELSECKGAGYRSLGRRWSEIHETWTAFRNAHPA